MINFGIWLTQSLLEFILISPGWDWIIRLYHRLRFLLNRRKGNVWFQFALQLHVAAHTAVLIGLDENAAFCKWDKDATNVESLCHWDGKGVHILKTVLSEFLLFCLWDGKWQVWLIRFGLEFSKTRHWLWVVIIVILFGVKCRRKTQCYWTQQRAGLCYCKLV